MCKPATSRLAESVLRTCKAIDASAHIISILKDGEGRTSIHLRCADSSPAVLTSALNANWPLSDISITENLLDGVTEAVVGMPAPGQTYRKAKSRAASLAVARLLSFAWLCLAGLACVSYSKDVYDARMLLVEQRPFDPNEMTPERHDEL